LPARFILPERKQERRGEGGKVRVYGKEIGKMVTKVGGRESRGWGWKE